MKILVKAGYTHNKVRVWHEEKSLDELPIDVATSMVCDNLNRIPKEGEIIYLGKSIPHHYPSDVMVKLATDQQVKMLDSLEGAEMVDVAKFAGEDDLSEENVEGNYLDIKCDAEYKVWDMSDEEIELFLE